MPFDGLSDDQIRDTAPSVFATHPSSKVSERYAYLPSYQVVRAMRSLGFAPVKVREGTKRAPDGAQYALHEIRFQKDPELWAGQTRELGMLIPEAVFRNSHDRTSGADFSAGLSRLVCLNGMTVGEQSLRFSARHTGRLQDSFHGAVQAIAAQFTRSIEVARRWQQIELTPEQTRQFAEAAVKARGTTMDLVENTVLFSRRDGDRGPDLWSTFNRAQENLTKGGMTGRTAQGGKYRALPSIKSLQVDIDFNKRLWNAASALADAIQPQVVVPALVPA